MADKSRFATRGRELAASMAILSDQIAAWRNAYWDRAYNDGGGAELVDADVAASGVTAVDVTGLTTFADALDAFLASNRPYLSKMRNDL